MWYLYAPWPWQKIVFIDGTTERGASLVYRRKVGECWQYRRMTEHEQIEWARVEAW